MKTPLETRDALFEQTKQAIISNRFWLGQKQYKLATEYIELVNDYMHEFVVGKNLEKLKSLDEERNKKRLYINKARNEILENF